MAESTANLSVFSNITVNTEQKAPPEPKLVLGQSVDELCEQLGYRIDNTTNNEKVNNFIDFYGKSGKFVEDTKNTEGGY